MIAEVITRLETLISVLNKRTHGAADYSQLIAGNKMPAEDVVAYVLPLGLQGGSANAGAGAFVQDFTESVGVVLAIKTYSGTGDRSLPELRGLVDQVINAIAGWTPDNEVGVFKLSRGNLISLSAGTMFYQLDFTVTDQLRIFS